MYNIKVYWELKKVRRLYMMSKVPEISEPICLKDFELRARYILPKEDLDYFGVGADEEVTLNDNINAFKR